MSATTMSEDGTGNPERMDRRGARGDAALFWPTLALFVAVLILTYLVTSPPDGHLIELLLGR